MDPLFGALVCGGLLAADLAIVGHATRVQLAVAVLGAAALGVRRLRPSAALTVMVIALGVQFVEVRQARAIDLAMLPVLYTCWAWGAVPTRLVAAVVAVGASALAAVSSPFTVGRTAGESAAVIGAAALLVGVGACGMGLLTRTQRALAEQLRLRAEQAEADRHRSVELAAERERARMARDVHDVVAHSLTVIAVQAQAGSFAASGPQHDSGVAAATLDSIADTAKTALTEVRGVLRLLRSPDPAPTQTVDLDAIIARARGTGLSVSTEEHGDARPITEHAAAAVQFLAREALTNTLRHAGAGAAVCIALTWTAGALDIAVENSGGRPPEWRSPGAGMGLVGMRERISAVGGRIEYGPAGDGFRVAATVPVS